MNTTRLAAILLFTAGLIASPIRAEVRLPAIFSDHMVLQRDATVPIWGWAAPGEEVVVSIAGQTKTTKADAGGKWRVQFAKLSAVGPQTLSVRGRNTINVQDVLIGEVWLASGQSNMQMTLAATEDFARERAAADYPQFRIFNVVHKTARKPQTDCQGQWLVCSPSVVEGSASTAYRFFSGTAYYFGRELHQKLGVPVGMIHSSMAGSLIEAWTSLEAQQARPELKPLLTGWEKKDQKYDSAAAQAKYEKDLSRWSATVAQAKAEGQPRPTAPKKPVHPRDDYAHPAGLFNAMIAPLIPCTIRGVIWYQGESNGRTAESCRLYGTQLPALITDWRERWGQGAFPFAWVQLPNYNEAGRHWPLIREAMLKSLAVTNTGMAVAIDIGSTNTIHPLNKRDVGTRLALWARANVYGEKIPWSGPLPAGFTVKGREVELRFTHTDGGLVAAGGALRGFVMAGNNQQWKLAAARIEKDTVVVSSPEVEAPVAVRYAWDYNPDCNLFNGVGLPASPFRTDDWSR